MGWFDDNHYAGEAYNFGMGYSSLFLSPAGSSDDNSDDYGYSPYSDDEPYYGEYFRYRAAAMQVGGRSAVTGKYFFGTRKCSVCLRLKTKSDFSADEADQSAAKRCCTTCSQTIIDAMRSLDEKSKRDAVAVEFKVQSPPEPDNATIVVGKTHRVYGPDNSSFGMLSPVTCSYYLYSEPAASSHLCICECSYVQLWMQGERPRFHVVSGPQKVRRDDRGSAEDISACANHSQERYQRCIQDKTGCGIIENVGDQERGEMHPYSG